MDLKKSLRMAIAIRNIKHIELAALIGVNSVQISSWLREGKITSSGIDKLCTALEMKASEFIALGEK